MHAILQGHNELSKDGALGNDSKKTKKSHLKLTSIELR